MGTYVIRKCLAFIGAVKLDDGPDATWVTNATVGRATGQFMSPVQQVALSTQMWGLLARCLSGEDDGLSMAAGPA